MQYTYIEQIINYAELVLLLLYETPNDILQCEIIEYKYEEGGYRISVNEYRFSNF